MRWFFAVKLCIRCARVKPISALAMTAVMANRQLWKITRRKVLRWNKKTKFPNPTNSVIRLFSRLR